LCEVNSFVGITGMAITQVELTKNKFAMSMKNIPAYL